MTENNHHACALQIDQTGILIKGRSGSGKTSLMMGLLEYAQRHDLEAFLIADDQVCLSLTENQLVARVPHPIAGLIEVQGYGIISQPHKDETQINLVVEIIEDHDVERMPEAKFFNFETRQVSLLEVPLRHETQAVRIVIAWLTENGYLQV